ncbi:MAG: hypothetical protein AMXMBFR12_01570 [Candidatus Babeliales bacterium]
MKKLFFYITSIFSSFLQAYPTCVAHANPPTVPFFSEEFYKPGKAAQNTPQYAVEYGKKELQKLIDEHKGKK